MLLYYVRHGDPVYEPNSLTPLGARQAEAVGRRIGRYPIDEIYSSDSARAVLTAKPLCELQKKEMILLPWTNEDLAYEQMSTEGPDGVRRWFFAQKADEALLCSPELQKYGMKWYEHPAYKGTSIEAGYRRIQKETRAFLEAQGFLFDEEVGRYRVLKKNDRRVALFAHHGFGVAFLSIALNIPYSLFATRMGLSHSSLQVIHFDDSERYCTPCMITHGNDAHLYEENLPTRFENRIFY